MKTPFEIINNLREDELSIDWVSKMYSETEFKFTIVTSALNSKDFSYTKQLNELSEQEIKFLIGNWINNYDNRDKSITAS